MLFIGIIAALGALIFELLILIIFPIASEIFLDKISFILILGVLVEESFKLIIIWKIYNLAQNKNNIFLNSIFIGAGFFLMEFVLSVSAYRPLSVIKLAGLSQYLGPLFVHLSTSAIFGYYFYKLKKTFITGAFVFFLAIILHLAFNISVIF